MDTTRTQEAGARSHRPVRSLVLIAIALAIVLSMAVVNASTHHASTGGQLTTTVAPISIPKTDPAARIHLHIAKGLDKLSRRTRDDRRVLAPSFLWLVRSMNSASIRSSPQPEGGQDGVRDR